MKPILQNPTARLWCLSGLTGMVLMAGVLLEEGQARTYSPSHRLYASEELGFLRQDPQE